jgi:uncharacterized protein
VNIGTYIVKYADLLLSLTAEMAPYLLLGFILAGITHAFFPREWIKTHLDGNGFMQSLKASLFGVPLPVCSCGIIPLAKELKKTGASNAGVAAFLASTPQTGVDSVAATTGLMGWPFAVIRVVVAFISGVFTGTLIGVSEKSVTSSPEIPNPALPDRKGERSIPKILHYALIELPGDIRNSLTLGLLIAAAISLFLPEFTKFTGDGNAWIGYFGIMLLAIPLYVCSTGSIPIAIALITSGFSAGSALIFLIAGPATNIVTLVTMTDIIGWKNTGLYLVSVIGIALLSAILIDSSLMNIDVQSYVGHIHENSISWFKWLCAAILIFSLFYDYVAHRVRKIRKHTDSQEHGINWKHYQLTVKGIGCKKCAAKITSIIENIKRHRNVQIDIEKGIVRFEAEKMDSEGISEKLLSEGYTVLKATEYSDS